MWNEMWNEKCKPLYVIAQDPGFVTENRDMAGFLTVNKALVTCSKVGSSLRSAKLHKFQNAAILYLCKFSYSFIFVA